MEIEQFTCLKCENIYPKYRFSKKTMNEGSPVCKGCRAVELNFKRRGQPTEITERKCTNCANIFQSIGGKRVCWSCDLQLRKAKKYYA